MTSPTAQERFEDIEKLTNEQVGQYLDTTVRTAAAGIQQVLDFSKAVISTQGRELTLLRELEAGIRQLESNTELDEAAVAAIYARCDLILAQLTLFRQKIAEQNAKQATPEPAE